MSTANVARNRNKTTHRRRAGAWRPGREAGRRRSRDRPTRSFFSVPRQERDARVAPRYSWIRARDGTPRHIGAAAVQRRRRRAPPAQLPVRAPAVQPVRAQAAGQHRQIAAFRVQAEGAHVPHAAQVLAVLLQPEAEERQEDGVHGEGQLRRLLRYLMWLNQGCPLRGP